MSYTFDRINNQGLIFNGDCLEVLPDLIKSNVRVDAIICDIPYGTTACKWDSIIPFDTMWSLLNQLITNSGAICLFGSEPFSSQLRCSNLSMYKYDWIWYKSRPTNFAMAKNQPLRDYENVVVFSKGAAIHQGQSKNRMTYNPQGLVDCFRQKKQKLINKTDTCFSDRKSQPEIHTQTQTNYPRQVLKFNSESNTLHPTQKPVDLMEYLVKTYSYSGGVILDFTMGSGTTCVACKNTNRRFIGIEKEEKYYNIAKKRIIGEIK